jgi:hypothetical protein
MQPLISTKYAPEPHRVSGEVLLGVTVGGYVFLAVALYCFGFGLMQPGVTNDMPPFRPYSEDPGTLIFLVPAIFVGALSYLQVIAGRIFKRPPNQKAVRVALWLNMMGSLGFCMIAALKRPPNNGEVPADAYVQLVALILILLSFLVGILTSIINIFSGLMPVRKLQVKS